MMVVLTHILVLRGGELNILWTARGQRLEGRLSVIVTGVHG